MARYDFSVYKAQGVPPMMAKGWPCIRCHEYCRSTMCATCRLREDIRRAELEAELRAGAART